MEEYPLKNGVENQCGTARGGCGATSEERSSERERGGDDTELLKRRRRRREERRRNDEEVVRFSFVFYSLLFYYGQNTLLGVN